MKRSVVYCIPYDADGECRIGWFMLWNSYTYMWYNNPNLYSIVDALSDGLDIDVSHTFISLLNLYNVYQNMVFVYV